MDFARPAFTEAVAALYQEVGREEGDRLLGKIRIEAEKLFGLDWLRLPQNITAKAGNRRYRCAFSPVYEFTFRRESVRQSHRVVEEQIWLTTIRRRR